MLGRQTLAHIATAIGISIPTLRKAFAAEIADVEQRRAADADAETAPLLALAAKAKKQRRRRPSPSRGRPAYEPNMTDRETVTLLVADNWKQDDIAAVIGVSTPTLTKAFANEIHTGALKKRAETLRLLNSAAKRGNVTAQRALLDRLDVAQLHRLGDTFTRPDAEPGKAKPETVGKKIAAAQEARDVLADSEWSDVLRPGATLGPTGNA